MDSQLFRTGPRTRTLAIGLCAALFVFGAAPAQDPIVKSPPLGTIVRAALSQARGKFVAWRAGTQSVDAYSATYKPSAMMKQVCPVCTVADEFATADTDERFALTLNWIVPKTFSRAQTIAYIQIHVGALLPNFNLQQGTESGESWFFWTKGSPTEFVYVKTFEDKSGNGFRVRVAQYLKNNLHYTKYARLSATQRSDLAKAVRNFVQLGVQNGSDNFVSLRGAATDKENSFFHTNVSFGEFMTSCNVSSILFKSVSDGTSKWVLDCDTPSLGGAKSDVEAIISAAVSAALPDGFSATTDPKYLNTNDYRWDRSADTMAVEVSAYDMGNGTFDYHVEIYHFTT